MRTNLGRRVGIAWNAARFFARAFIEYVLTVWLLGIAPFVAHLAAMPARHSYGWIPDDLYLFVMVIGGSTAIEAFKDRECDGPSRPFAAMMGLCFAVASAWAFGALQAGTAPPSIRAQSVIGWAIVGALGIDVSYRVLPMIRNAFVEARIKC
ncbi:MAG: hypothetical protein JO083_02245 [Candidatus Eremiobacteraeota bacterium]|nr:hypothetical protein [Candidatus Eremiobacteraeota bacterium]